MDFIVRVYGIYIDKQNRLLVSDEIVRGENVTKLPGGGLEYGEGTIDCLKREMIEETGFEFDIISHFYTTDFFVDSAYHERKQVISIYYIMKPVSTFNIEIAEERFQFKNLEEGAQSFRFVRLEKLKVEEFSFPIDRVVIGKLREVF